MKNQVTSIEQSKRLIEMGVPAGRASMIWDKSSVGRRYRLGVWNTDDATKEWEYRLDPQLFIPAFTVADLLGMIPKSIITPQGKVHTLHIEACSSTSPSWCLFWGDEEVQIGWQERLSIAHLLEDAIEWLLSKGYKLEV